VPRRRRWWRWALVLGGLALAGPLYLAGSILWYGQRSDREPADAAVVLGAAVWTDRPSPVFEERIRHGVDLYRTGQVEVLVFTGGLAEGDRLAEAEVARVYAASRGVPADRIFIETASTTTFENLREARAILEREGLHRVLVVSDPLHMKRAVQTARRLGIDAHPSPTPTSRYRSLARQLPFLLRETYFYARSLLRPGAPEDP
jgi:uncharacterized SAM-binding protein YcdF (DUF218 family)